MNAVSVIFCSCEKILELFLVTVVIVAQDAVTTTTPTRKPNIVISTPRSITAHVKGTQIPLPLRENSRRRLARLSKEHQRYSTDAAAVGVENNGNL
jgi:hypothetical protein